MRGNGLYASLDVEPSPRTLIQIGFDLEGVGTRGVDNCGAGGNSLRISAEWEVAGRYRCDWGPAVAPGQAHELGVARCARSGDWCAFVDGKLFGRPHRLGPNTAHDMYVGVEQYVDTTSSRFDVEIAGLQVAQGGRPARGWAAVSDADTCTVNSLGNFEVSPITDGVFSVLPAVVGEPRAGGCY
ncbi:MAG: hypothetical protein ACTHNU_17770 [Gaiellales bacterium]